MKAISWVFLAAVFAISFALFAGINSYEKRAAPLAVYGEPDHTLPDFSFINQQGETINRSATEGSILVVNSFFSSCPSICPSMTRNLQEVHDYFRTDNEVLMLSLTVDPATDTIGRLLQFANIYHVDHSSWHFLTGDKQELYRFIRKGLYLSASEGPGDESDFIHSENVVLIDQKGRIRGYYNGTDASVINDLKNDIGKLKSGKSKSARIKPSQPTSANLNSSNLKSTMGR